MTAPTPPARIVRRLVLLALAMLVLPLTVAPVRASTPEEAFVTSISDQAIKILSNKQLDKQGRYDAFHSLILNNIDLDRIAAFALGRYAGAMRASGRYDEYKSQFGDYIARVYAVRLSGYSGEHVKLERTIPHGPNDVVVYSVIEPGAEGGDPVPVNWRLSKKDDQLKILDVQIIGAWMSIEQQSQFSSIIANNNRDATKLIDYLKEQNTAPLPDRSN